ncbi:Abi family protein [Aedoeadaptatus coxii]|uniref:Abi family protein n=1 Tax=Aedoeadaptatus coxii TaxID=755172 RepID=UPI002AD24ECA|nr:Abi family protein [Peptoniphilus coxii]
MFFTKESNTIEGLPRDTWIQETEKVFKLRQMQGTILLNKGESIKDRIENNNKTRVILGGTKVDHKLSKGKTTDGLMRHIRDNHKTEIGGSRQKQELLNMGYYHGYKALRFIKKRSNDQNYEKFDQIKAIHDFDNRLKRIFFPILIQVETSLKNRLIDCLVPQENPSIEYIQRYVNRL